MLFCYLINVFNLFYVIKLSFLILPLSLTNSIAEGISSNFGLLVPIFLYYIRVVYILLREAYILIKGPFCKSVKSLANRLRKVYSYLVKVFTYKRL